MKNFNIPQNFENVKFSKQELNKLMKTAKGIAQACEQDKLSEELTKEIVILTLQETAKEIANNKKK